ncbi:hypothetical protein FB451DRAFT_1556115 [Mycena latifolia]|nr:hypothetical protein FB451DRAFT_1556115 [Mycena latifolia]
MSFVSNVDHLALADGVFNNIHGNFNIVHKNFYGRKRYHEEIDAPDLLSTMGTRLKRRRREDDSEDRIKVIGSKHLKLTLEIGSGPGYYLHAGENKGRAVIVKVFNAGTARKQLESTVTLSKGLMHPNVLRIEGVSAPASLTHFIAYEGAHWKMTEGPLAAALKDDLTRSITLGFRMIAGLSSGMNHLSVQGISVASLGAENFDIFFDVNDRFLISINPPMSTEGESTDHPEPEYNTRKSWDVFNALCQKVLRSANRVLHTEDIERNPVTLDFSRQPSVPKKSSTSVSLASTELYDSPASQNLLEGEPPISPRREYVWRAMYRGHQSLASIASRIALDLDLKLSSVDKLAWTDGRSLHRCAGYVREEITLATTTSDSAVVSHDAPSPLEICCVCHEVVSVYEEFRCMCGDQNPGSRPTVKCQECMIWGHSDCVGYSREFTCQSCSLRVQSTVFARPSTPSSPDNPKQLPSNDKEAIISTAATDDGSSISKPATVETLKVQAPTPAQLLRQQAIRQLHAARERHLKTAGDSAEMDLLKPDPPKRRCRGRRLLSASIVRCSGKAPESYGGQADGPEALAAPSKFPS